MFWNTRSWSQSINQGLVTSIHSTVTLDEDQICWWHNSGVPHQQNNHYTLSRWGNFWTNSLLMWTQEDSLLHFGESQMLHISWCSHCRRLPNLQHYFPSTERPLVSQVPAETEKHKSPPFHPHHIVQGKHIEHPEQLSGMGIAASQTPRPSNWLRSSSGSYFNLSWMLKSIRHMNNSLTSHLAQGTRAPGLLLTDYVIASTPTNADTLTPFCHHPMLLWKKWNELNWIK